MLDSTSVAIVWMLLYLHPTENYMFHAGEYGTRDSCVKAAALMLDMEGQHPQCWPIRKLMEE